MTTDHDETEENSVRATSVLAASSYFGEIVQILTTYNKNPQKKTKLKLRNSFKIHEWNAGLGMCCYYSVSNILNSKNYDFVYSQNVSDMFLKIISLKHLGKNSQFQWDKGRWFWQ